MEPFSKRARVEPTVSSNPVATFDVGGRHFKVMKLVLMRHPDTLLATMLNDISTVEDEVLYVDANPESFQHILDWYRYGEMHVKTEYIPAILNDSRYFLLPDFVKINGRSHDLIPSCLSVDERMDQHNAERYGPKAADEAIAETV